MSRRLSDNLSESDNSDSPKSLLEMAKLTHRFVSGGFSGREVARIIKLGSK